jgi:hypothetical protein
MNILLMHRDTVVARLRYMAATNTLAAVDEMLDARHMPIGTMNASGQPDIATLNLWWQSRAIPLSRTGLRDAMELLAISQPGELVLRCHGLSLSDQYWFCPAEKPLAWADVNFFDHAFSEDIGNALFGTAPRENEPDWMSPCSTSDGWLPKRWKIMNGKRCLLKGGSGPFRQEPFNEIAACLLMDRLNIPHVDYQVVWDGKEPYCVCADFLTRDTELVPMMQIYKALPQQPEQSLYQHVLRCCDTLDIPDIRKPLAQMLTVDALIANTDRHLGNFGAIRNAKTLEWIGLAPVYDSGTSFWVKEATADISADAPVQCRPFAKSHAQQLALAASDTSWINFEALEGIEDALFKTFTASRYMDETRCMAISKAVVGRIEGIRR